MRFLIVGAGGIGGYYAARLQTAGHDVTLIARNDHLQALQHLGLVVEHPQLSFHQAVTAMDETQLLAQTQVSDFDWILLCLKTQSTQGWLSRWSSWLSQGSTPVLSLQNGIDNEEWIAQALGVERTLGGLAVRIGAHRIAPGVIEAKGPAQIIFGAWPQARSDQASASLQALDQAFQAAGIPSTLTDQIQVELWKKLLLNNALNPLSALTGLTTRQLVEDADYGPVVRALMHETAAVGRACQINLSEQDAEQMFALIASFDAIKTSMLVDREQGRELELEGISGAVIRRAEAQGVAVPLTRLIQRQLLNSLQSHQPTLGAD